MDKIFAHYAVFDVRFLYKLQVMATFQDDSTDDEIGVNLQLAERLSINKSDHGSSHRSLPNGKALKQLHNYQRKNHLHDYKSSSSSSSLDTHSDPLVLEGSSSFGLHNKKRQNGDKNLEHFNNSKRTCLGDRLLRSPEWKMSGNDIPDVMHSLQPANSSVRNLYPDKTYEDHLNNMSDDDSDFQPRRRLPSKSVAQGAVKSSRTLRGIGLSKTSKKLFENQPSVSSGVHFIDSTSDDDSRTVVRNGALKGGRQTPEISDKKRWGRKIAKVLDSDSDDLQGDYRSRPVIFSSSSDSDDCRPSEKNKSNATSKKFANPSFSPGNSHESDNRYYMDQDEPMHSRFNGAGSSRQFNSFVPTSISSDYRTKNSSDKTSKVPSKPSSSSYQNSYPVTNDIEPAFQGRGGASSSRKSHSRSPSSSQHLHGHRHSGIRKSPKGIGAPRQNQVHPSETLSDVLSGIGNNSHRSPDFQPDHFPPVKLSMSSCHPRDGNHSIRSVTRPVTGRHHRANSRKTLKGRCLNGACSQDAKSDLAAMYPDIFDAEDSSEVEFFTANSYSDNESNTESLTNLRVNPNPRIQPIQRQEALSDNPVSVVSSEDEISVVFSSAPRHRTSNARRASRTLGRRYRRGGQGFRSSGHDVVSLSPDPVEQVRQVEEDERFARMLQAQFDAETDPSYVPCRLPSPNPPRIVSRAFLSSDDDSSLDLQMEPESLNRLTYDSLTTNPLLRGLHVRLSRYPMTPAFYSSAGGRPTTRNRRRPDAADIETHFMNWNPATTLSLFNFDTSDDSYEAFLGLAELNGEVSRGLQRTEINRLPTRKYVIPNGASSSKSSEVPHKRAELNKECQVCLNDYVNGDVLRILPCFHEFHTPCIDPWLKINHTCPVCRVIVSLEE